MRRFLLRGLTAVVEHPRHAQPIISQSPWPIRRRSRPSPYMGLCSATSPAASRLPASFTGLTQSVSMSHFTGSQRALLQEKSLGSNPFFISFIRSSWVECPLCPTRRVACALQLWRAECSSPLCVLCGVPCLCQIRCNPHYCWNVQGVAVTVPSSHVDGLLL